MPCALYVYVHVCMYVCMHVCTCMYACMYVHVCMHVCTCTCFLPVCQMLLIDCCACNTFSIPDLGTEPGPCLCDLESHVDENSLAIIAQNKCEIVRRLSQRREKDHIPSGMERGNGQSELGHVGLELGSDEMETRRGNVPSLNRVLLELDSILRNKLCTEGDLIQAIESQLNIQFRPQDNPIPSQPQERGEKDMKEYQIDDDVILENDDVIMTSPTEKGAELMRTHSYENLKEWVDTTDSNVSSC